MSRVVIGWDIGGANIKAASICDSGCQVLDRPFPLWGRPERLATALAQMCAELGSADAMALTMTAELADCFETKREGVRFVLAAAVEAFPDIRIHVFGVDAQFHPPDLAAEQPECIAAANWMATATMVATEHPDALLVDVGSTTTDIIPIAGGRVVARGLNDTARLGTGELVYTGALRTPVCAVVRAVPLTGHRVRVAAEVFAITADVYRWLGGIDDAGYTPDTPDGKGRDRLSAGRRLARMIGADLEGVHDTDVDAIARHVARVQVRTVASAIRQVRQARRPAAARAIVVGTGRFLGRRAAGVAGLEVIEPSGALGPAVAVATLLRARLRAGDAAARP
jgi:hypothetical protein